MFAINKAFLFFLVAVYSLIGLINSCHSATNIALGKPYTISSKPNYSRSAPPTDVSALTDGKFTIGYFWTQKTTLGWRKIRPVEIIIDLGKSFAISSISFSTARRKAAEVYYPENIAAFIGSDKNHWRYVGDIAKNPDNVPGAYQVKKFILNDISAQGRYVFLQIHPKGPYLFCDEIEIHEGKQTNGVAGTLSMNDARNLSEQLRRVGINKRLLTRLVESLKTGINQRPQLTRHLANIEQRIQAATPPLDIVEAIESDLLGLHGEMLRTQYPGKDFLVCPIDPWTKASPVYPVTGHSKVDISLVTPVGGYDTTSFMITNLATKPRQFSFSFADKVTDTSEVFLYQIPFVKSAAMEYVADPLVPLKDNISLRPGESRMVLMAVRGSKAGIWRTSLKVFCDGTEVLIPVESIVTKVAMPRRFTLNSVTWSYLNFKPTRTLKTEAMNDLFAHHTKVVVFHPNDLTLVDQPTRVDFIRMNKTFELNKGADKVLLLMNFRKDRWLTANGKYEFLSDQWKKWFRKWYVRVRKAAAAAGFTDDQIYLYPYDEMRGAEIDQFITFAAWVRTEAPGFRLYATLGSKGSEKALPYLDIAQVHNNDAVLKNFNSSTAELWLYDAKGPAKSLSPYSYYRMMAWKAFFHGYKGIGFWAYADSGWSNAPSSAWDDFDGNYPDYAVIYEGEGNTIISSRRWEAWRMGIEDYELLMMYAKAKGERTAKTIAQSVIDHPEDTFRADEVRRKILIELSNTNS